MSDFDYFFPMFMIIGLIVAMALIIVLASPSDHSKYSICESGWSARCFHTDTYTTDSNNCAIVGENKLCGSYTVKSLR
jgi:hypothetical protein